MKKSIFISVSIIIACIGQAQQLNDKGVYQNSEGDLFSGVVSKTTDGIKSVFHVKDGVINGEAYYYYSSGRVMEKGSFTSGKKDEKWTRYSEDGSVTAVAFYHLGKKDGTWLVYDNQGNKRFEMVYKDGEKSGIWTSWDEKGSVVSSKNYGISN